MRKNFKYNKQLSRMTFFGIINIYQQMKKFVEEAFMD